MRLGMLLLLVLLFIGIAWIIFLGVRRKSKRLFITGIVLALLAVIASIIILFLYA